MPNCGLRTASIDARFCLGAVKCKVLMEPAQLSERAGPGWVESPWAGSLHREGSIHGKSRQRSRSWQIRFRQAGPTAWSAGSVASASAAGAAAPARSEQDQQQQRGFEPARQPGQPAECARRQSIGSRRQSLTSRSNERSPAVRPGFFFIHDRAYCQSRSIL